MRRSRHERDDREHAPSSLSSAVAELESPGAKKFRTARNLIALSEKDPSALVPFFDDFRRLMGAENKIIKWSVYQIIANLACADRRGRIAAILDEYLAPIKGPAMVTAANAIRGGAKIAAAHEGLAPRIASAILGVERARYKTAECRNVAIGHAVTALESMGDDVKRPARVVAFVKRQTRNRRAGTRKKAEAFLMRIRGETSRGAHLAPR
ncbi:MAG: hypothetical protein WCP22_02405 [Chlamydiota bacterium]